MPRDSRGLDHVIILARDLDTSEKLYNRMGFQTAPRMFHPFGTANNLIMFENNFLELLGVVSPDALVERSMRFLRQVENRAGLAAVALLSTDAKHDRDDFDKHGLSPGEIFHFRRQVTLPDGRQTAAEVDVVDISSNWPLMRFFVSHQHVREAIWVQEWQTHPNGAEAMESVGIVHDRPQEMADYFSRLLGAASVRQNGLDELVVRTPNGFIDVHSPGTFRDRYGMPSEQERPYLASVEIRVRSLAVLADILRREALPTIAQPGAIVLQPEYATGVVLRFVEKSRSK